MQPFVYEETSFTDTIASLTDNQDGTWDITFDTEPGTYQMADNLAVDLVVAQEYTFTYSNIAPTTIHSWRESP